MEPLSAEQLLEIETRASVAQSGPWRAIIEALTQQHRDAIDYAPDNGPKFDLYVRPGQSCLVPLCADLDPLNPLNIGYTP